MDKVRVTVDDVPDHDVRSKLIMVSQHFNIMTNIMCMFAHKISKFMFCVDIVTECL